MQIKANGLLILVFVLPMRIHIKHLFGDAPPPRIPVGNEGLGSDSLLKICMCIYIYIFFFILIMINLVVIVTGSGSIRTSTKTRWIAELLFVIW